MSCNKKQHIPSSGVISIKQRQTRVSDPGPQENPRRPPSERNGCSIKFCINMGKTPTEI